MATVADNHQKDIRTVVLAHVLSLLSVLRDQYQCKLQIWSKPLLDLLIQNILQLTSNMRVVGGRTPTCPSLRPHH